MTFEEIKKKANDYIRLENSDFFRNEVEQLLNDNSKEADLRDRFYTDLDFGTGGLRGVIGGGFNRMNPFTVQRATQGLANYIKKNIPKSEQSVVISYDSRNYSDVFAENCALVLAGNGIKTYLLSALRPTPELSFAVRHYKTAAGIMVTASHNPAEYNGYKVFWNDGAQVTPPHDKGIIEEVRKISDEIIVADKNEAISAGLLVEVLEDLDRTYFDRVKELVINPELFQKHASKLKIVYTPLHGTGTVPVETILSDMGLDIFTVPEQREPDGDFPTVAFPNPEIAPAMDLALQYAKKQKADIVLGTDPDSDRLGIAVPVNGEYQLISGNQLGALLGDYIFSAMKEKGTLPENAAFVNTIVTTDLQNKIAKSYGAADFKVLTGFKYIGEKIREWENNGQYKYIFGGEESYGFLVGTDVRDKDAVSAALLTVEMALWNVVNGRSVINHLDDIYSRYGYYQELLISKYFKGESGLQVMADLMNSLRNNPPEEWNGVKTAEARDFLDSSTFIYSENKKIANIELPSSNVLQYELVDGTLITVRPSGTEPKIKFYASCCATEGMDLNDAKALVAKKVSAIEKAVENILPE